MDNGFKKEIGAFIFLVLLSVFLLFLDKKEKLGLIHKLADPPVLAAEERLYFLSRSISESLYFLESTKSKERQIQRLQGQLLQLAFDRNELMSCLEKNDHLEKLLGAPLPSNWHFIQARVVGVNERMRIDLGKKDGIEEGMTVVSENIFAGRIISIGENSSLVQLPDDPLVKIPVVVKQLGSSPVVAAGGVQARGLLTGRLQGQLILDRVLQNEDIQKGDLVITSGEGGEKPDLLIGQIDEVLPRTAEIYKKATVSPLIDYRKLIFVFVVVK